jgi:Big-like domain-containing protein
MTSKFLSRLRRRKVGVFRRLAVSTGLTLALLCAAAVASASAAPPANDAKDSATLIAGLPYTDTIDTTEATTGPEDDAAATACGFDTSFPKSVWYQYTPTVDQSVVLDLTDSDYSVGAGVGTGDDCLAAFADFGSFVAQANHTYWIALVDMGDGAGGSLHLSVTENHAPVCEDVAVSVQADKSVEIPFPQCTDADEDPFDVFIIDEPAHGTFDYGNGMYTPAAGFSGKDSMTFQALDTWDEPSGLGVIRITVTPAPTPHPAPPPDVTAPTLELLAPSSLNLRTTLRRGIQFTVTSDEPGRLVVRALVTRKVARQLKIKKNATGPVAVGRLARDIAAGQTVVKVKLLRTARNKLKHAKRVKLRIVATITDAAGNERAETLRLTLKRGSSS